MDAKTDLPILDKAGVARIFPKYRMTAVRPQPISEAIWSMLNLSTHRFLSSSVRSIVSF